MGKSSLLQPVTEKDDLLALASRIRDDLPYSVSIYNNLLMKARRYNSCFGYDFFVLSSYPESHIVIWVKDGLSVGLHCLEEETPLLVKALQDAQLLRVDLDVEYFFHLPDYLLNPLYEIVRLRCQGRIIRGRHYTFICQDNENYPLKCPAGMRVCRLGRAGVRHLLQMSTYNKDTNVEHMITFTANAPAVGVYLDPSLNQESLVDLTTIDFADPEAIPIAWISSYPYGSLGMLMTAEEYRGQGLASLITQVAARLQMEQGYIPHVHVDFDNPGSAALFSKLPGWVKAHVSSWLVLFKSETSVKINES